MAILGVFTNARVIVNSVDLSYAVREVEATEERAAVDVTAMGAGYVAEAKGLGTAVISVTFLQDYSAGKVHQTLQPLVGSSTPVPVRVLPDAGLAISATNPEIQLLQALMFNYTPLGGTIGDAAETPTEFRNAPGGTGFTYDITP